MNAEQRIMLDRAWDQVFIARTELLDAGSAQRWGTSYANHPMKNQRLLERVVRAERRLKAAQDHVESLLMDIAEEDVDALVNAYAKGKKYAFEVMAGELRGEQRDRANLLAARAVGADAGHNHDGGAI